MTARKTSSEIETALRAAAAEGIGGPRAVTFDTAAMALSFLLREVETTVLARRLTFVFDDGNRLVCDAANRRLLRVLPPEGGARPPEELGLPLSSATPDALSAAAGHIARLCAPPGRVRLESAIPVETDDPTTAGVATDDLAAALDLPGPEGTGAADPLDAILAASDDDLTCAIRYDRSGSRAQIGAARDLALLSDWTADMAARALDDADPLGQALGPRGLLVLGMADRPATLAFIARAGGECLVGLAPAALCARLVATWSRH